MVDNASHSVTQASASMQRTFNKACVCNEKKWACSAMQDEAGVSNEQTTTHDKHNRNKSRRCSYKLTPNHRQMCDWKECDTLLGLFRVWSWSCLCGPISLERIKIKNRKNGTNRMNGKLLGFAIPIDFILCCDLFQSNMIRIILQSSHPLTVSVRPLWICKAFSVWDKAFGSRTDIGFHAANKFFFHP